MDKDSAVILYDVLELSLSGNWPEVRSLMLEAGYSKREILYSLNKLALLAGRDMLVEESDFDS